MLAKVYMVRSDSGLTEQLYAFGLASKNSRFEEDGTLYTLVQSRSVHVEAEGWNVCGSMPVDAEYIGNYEIKRPD